VLLVVGDDTSTKFSEELKEFRQRRGVGMKVNLLVNYGWEWDLAGLKNSSCVLTKFHVWI
jgi:undecaprenyl diphosphate synthase